MSNMRIGTIMSNSWGRNRKVLSTMQFSAMTSQAQNPSSIEAFRILSLPTTCSEARTNISVMRVAERTWGVERFHTSFNENNSKHLTWLTQKESSKVFFVRVSYSSQPQKADCSSINRGPLWCMRHYAFLAPLSTSHLNNLQRITLRGAAFRRCKVMLRYLCLLG